MGFSPLKMVSTLCNVSYNRKYQHMDLTPVPPLRRAQRAAVRADGRLAVGGVARVYPSQPGPGRLLPGACAGCRTQATKEGSQSDTTLIKLQTR